MSTQDAPMCDKSQVAGWAKVFCVDQRAAFVGDGCWAEDLFPVGCNAINYAAYCVQ